MVLQKFVNGEQNAWGRSGRCVEGKVTCGATTSVEPRLVDLVVLVALVALVAVPRSKAIDMAKLKWLCVAHSICNRRLLEAVDIRDFPWSVEHEGGWRKLRQGDNQWEAIDMQITA